jgi:hypothetical protein
MNSTRIDMRTLGPDIYMYIEGKIYKEPELSRLDFKSSWPTLDAQIEQSETAALVEAGPRGSGFVWMRTWGGPAAACLAGLRWAAAELARRWCVSQRPEQLQPRADAKQPRWPSGGAIWKDNVDGMGWRRQWRSVVGVSRREDDGLEKIDNEQNELGRWRCCMQVPCAGLIREREEQTLTLIFLL